MTYYHEHQFMSHKSETAAVALTTGIASATFRYARQTLQQIPPIVQNKTKFFNGRGDFMIAGAEGIKHYRYDADRNLRYLPRTITIDWLTYDQKEYDKANRLYARQLINLGEQQLHGASPMRPWRDIVTAWDSYWSGGESVTLSSRPHKRFQESNRLTDQTKRSASRATVAIGLLHELATATDVVDRIAHEYGIQSDQSRSSEDARQTLDSYWGTVLSNSLDIEMALE